MKVAPELSLQALYPGHADVLEVVCGSPKANSFCDGRRASLHTCRLPELGDQKCVCLSQEALPQMAPLQLPATLSVTRWVLHMRWVLHTARPGLQLKALLALNHACMSFKLCPV